MSSGVNLLGFDPLGDVESVLKRPEGKKFTYIDEECRDFPY
jgi:hypothetical protein